MATITLSVGALTRSKTISAGDVTRVTDAMKIKFGLPVGATNQQVFDAFGDWMFGLMKTEVLMQEREAVARTARAAVTDIPLT